MRFEVTNVLDAIERHLTTDAALAQAVFDLGEIAWCEPLGGARSVNLVRLGQLLDALTSHLHDSAVLLYPVAGKDLLTDADLTSKERMVLGRWAGDGLIEVVPSVADRVPEIGELTGLPVITVAGFGQFEERYPWLRDSPDRVLWLTTSEGGGRIQGGPSAPAGATAASALLRRVWRCPQRDCPTFGDRRGSSQPVVRLRAGVAVCPRHEEPLQDIGPRPPYLVMSLIVDSVVRDRFAVRHGRPVTVGRSPEDPDGVMIGAYLSGVAAQMISRSHLRLELREDMLMVSDVSTNGTVVRSRTSPYAPADEVRLSGGAPYPLRPWDTVELHQGVILSRADNPSVAVAGDAGSVLGESPTIMLRSPES